ncbi:alpha-amylase family glycosyl hydrolase [Alteromonas facilis]|uniref:alpha-amylase family glycosyl hydrolase n=1 Tax=Alteromonas facilis TaxID=2048004 RepID=UPI000C282E63|nr:alpha-amylase family glycosyl hydrolase [Alteromonas facilis]
MNRIRLSILLLAISAGLAGCKPAPDEGSAAIAEQQAPVIPLDTAPPPEYASHIRDVRDDVFYFVLPDRFNNADPSNDNGFSTQPISAGGLDVTSKWAFHGGDMKGIEEKLDYLQGLGVTAIWMTPILRNQAIQSTGFAHHGYWILDFTQIDPHFGGNDDLRSLIDAAHAKGMKIFFDIITNHTADVIRYKECHKPDGSFIEGESECAYKSTQQLAEGDSYTPYIPEGLESVKTPAWLNDPKYYHNQGDSFWQGESALNGDFVGLDDLRTSDPFVVQGMIDIYKNIISEFKPDGFRIDTVKHVDLSFWEAFSPAIMEHALAEGIEHFHIFGEVYDGNPAVLSRYTTLGNMPSVLDFGIQFATNDFFFKDDPVDSLARLIQNDDYYNDADSDPTRLMNFLGNHDMGRVGMFIQQAQPDASEAEQLRRNLLAHAFMYVSRGVPVIYYGDEQGFTGDGGDVDSRENMFASQVASYNDNDLIGTDATTADNNFDPDHPLYQGLRALAGLRLQHDTLRYGYQHLRSVSLSNTDVDSSRVLAFSRVEPDKNVEYLAVFNPNASSVTATIPARAVYEPIVAAINATQQDDSLSLSIAPFSFALYRSQSAVVPSTPVNVELEQYAENQRIRFDYKITYQQPNDMPLVSVSTYALDKQGQRTLLSTDYTQDYAAVVPPRRLLGNVEIEVVVDNLQGVQLSKRFPIDLSIIKTPVE